MNIDQIKNSTPPRSIPYTTMRNDIRLLLVSVLIGLGLIFIICGILLAFAVFPKRLVYWVQVKEAEENMKRKNGTITETIDTGIKTGGYQGTTHNPKRDEHLWRINYRFGTGDQKYTGYGFVEEREQTLRENYQKGNEVAVRYAADNPEISKLRKGPINKSGFFGLIALAFPFTGILATLVGTQMYRNDRQLLTWGLVKNARIKQITPGRIKIGRFPAYHVFCEMESGSNQPVRIPTMGLSIQKLKDWQNNGTLITVLVPRYNTKDGLIITGEG